MYRPDKDSGIPVKIAAAHEGVSKVRIRFFTKSNHFEKFGLQEWFAPLYVSESGAAPAGRDADRNQVASMFGSLGGAFQVGLERLDLGNSVICRQHSHRSGRISRSNEADAQRNCRGSIALCRFCKNIVFGMIRKHFADSGFLLLICQDQYVLRSEQSIQS